MTVRQERIQVFWPICPFHPKMRRRLNAPDTMVSDESLVSEALHDSEETKAVALDMFQGFVQVLGGR